MAAAMSGSASASRAVKNESGAEAVFGPALADMEEELMGEKSPPPQPDSGLAGGQNWRSKGCSRHTTLPGNGQALAVGTGYLCKMWWGRPPAGSREGGVERRKSCRLQVFRGMGPASAGTTRYKVGDGALSSRHDSVFPRHQMRGFGQSLRNGGRRECRVRGPHPWPCVRNEKAHKQI